MPLDSLDPSALLGAWAFTRVIDDHLAEDVKHVAGDAEFVAVEGGRIRWSESGILRSGNQRLPVLRTNYLARRGDGWFVTFEDGRDFHPWSPEESVIHHCGPDLYSGRISLVDELGREAALSREGTGQFTVRWRVTGPKKDYTMTTVLRRAVRSGPAPEVAAGCSASKKLDGLVIEDIDVADALDHQIP